MNEYRFKTHGRLALQAVFFFSAAVLQGFAQTGASHPQAGATPVAPAPAQPAPQPPPPATNIYGTSPGGHLDLSDERIRFWQWQVSRDPEFWTSLNGLAAAYAQKARETGDISYFELAEASLKQSLKAESTHVEAAPAYTQLATVHLAEHRFTEAGEDAAKAIALDPQELMPYPYAGDAQLELGNYAESQEFYDQLAAPKDGKPHPGIEFLAYSHGAGLDWIKGDTARATDDLQRSVKLADVMHMPAENIAWIHFMLGEQYFMMGDLVAAEREEAASLKSFPRYHRALSAMGQIRAAQGKFAEAIDYYKQAVAIIPLPIYAAALGDVYAVSGDKVNAEKQYALVEFIGKLSAINQQVFNRELAIFYADHDRKLPEALTLAQKELEVRHDVYTSDAIAWALLKNHQAVQARIEMEKALRMGTKDALMEYHAGMIYAALGDKTEATTHLKRALAINPHFHVIFADQAMKTLAGLDGQRPSAVVARGESADAVQH
jgi:tetratricopeptide (TPR) repeat protein